VEAVIWSDDVVRAPSETLEEGGERVAKKTKKKATKKKATKKKATKKKKVTKKKKATKKKK